MTPLIRGVIAVIVACVLMTAQPIGQVAPAVAWFCPMHPDVTSAESGKCRKCDMALVAGNPFDTRDYALTVTTEPAAITAGVPFRLRLRVGRPDSREAVKEYEVVHDKQFHLFVVSQDLREFQHLHPERQADGSWTLDVTLPSPGYYRILSDFLPRGGSPQFIGRTLVTRGFAGDLQSQAARLQPDAVLKKTTGSIVAEVALDPPRLVAGQQGHLEFTLTDARTGAPVTDLQPYLGAFGHTLILSEDLVDAVHSHPSEWRDGDPSRSSGGPKVTFEGYMPRPGRYRSWTQFLRNGELTTVSFTFSVLTLEEASR